MKKGSLKEYMRMKEWAFKRNLGHKYQHSISNVYSVYYIQQYFWQTSLNNFQIGMGQNRALPSFTS